MDSFLSVAFFLRHTIGSRAVPVSGPGAPSRDGQAESRPASRPLPFVLRASSPLLASPDLEGRIGLSSLVRKGNFPPESSDPIAATRSVVLDSPAVARDLILGAPYESSKVLSMILAG